MNANDSGVNLPMSDLPSALAGLGRERYAALRESVGSSLPDLEALPGDAARVLACSEYVAHSCTRDSDMLRDLLDSGDLLRSYDDTGASCYQQRTAAAIETSDDDATLMGALRDLKRREMVRIAWRDIGALADFDETLRETSSFADAVLRASVDRLHLWLASDFGEPLSADGAPQQLIVLALGKLGAGELNFSSDIDLIFCFPEAGFTVGGRKELSNDEYFRRLGQRLIKVLNERTDGGFVFRVDMRLRSNRARLVAHREFRNLQATVLESDQDADSIEFESRPPADAVRLEDQIGVDDFGAPGLCDVPVRSADRHLGVEVRAESELVARKVRLEDRLQHDDHRRLHHPVTDRGDAQRALAAIALGDPHPQQGLGPVALGPQLPPQRFQPRLHTSGLDRRERLAVHARRTAVRAAASVRLGQDILTADLVPQSVEAKGRFSLGFHLQ